MDRKRTFIKLAKAQHQVEKGFATVEEHGHEPEDPKEIKLKFSEGELDLWNKSNFHKKLGESNSKQRKSLRDVERQLQKTNEEKLEQIRREQEELERKKQEEDGGKKVHKDHKATKKATRATEKKSAMNANVVDFLAKAAAMEQERKEAALRVKQEQEKRRLELEQQAEAERIQIKRTARLSALELRRQKNGIRSALGLLRHSVLDKRHSLAVLADFTKERPVRLCFRTWSNLTKDKRHSKRAEAEFVLRCSTGLLLDTFHAIRRLAHPLAPLGLPEQWQRAVEAREFSPDAPNNFGAQLPRELELQYDDASASAAATPFAKQGSEQSQTSPCLLAQMSPGLSAKAPPFLGSNYMLYPAASTYVLNARPAPLRCNAPDFVPPPPSDFNQGFAARPPTPPSDDEDFPDLCTAAAGGRAPREPKHAPQPPPAKKEKAAWPPANFLRAQEEAERAASVGHALTASAEKAESGEFMLMEAHAQLREGQRLAKQGELLRALDCLEVAMCMRQGALGDGHPLTLDAMFELGAVCLDLGRHQASVDLLGRCAELRRQALGERHTETGKCMYHAALALANVGARSQSLVLMERAATAFEATVGKNDPRFARALARVLDAM